MFTLLYSYQAERKLREAHLKTQINQKLEESGERERLAVQCEIIM